jgi:hypothetical protein
MYHKTFQNMQTLYTTFALIKHCIPRLPDGCKPKSQLWYILGLGMDNAGIFYGQLEHFTAIWFIL